MKKTSWFFLDRKKPQDTYTIRVHRRQGKRDEKERNGISLG